MTVALHYRTRAKVNIARLAGRMGGFVRAHLRSTDLVTTCSDVCTSHLLALCLLRAAPSANRKVCHAFVETCTYYYRRYIFFVFLLF